MSRFLTRERPKKVLIEGAVCWKIHLTQGQYALIDVADEALVLPYRWYARKSSAGHLGTFLTAKDAHVAYCRAAQEHFGQLARFK